MTLLEDALHRRKSTIWFPKDFANIQVDFSLCNIAQRKILGIKDNTIFNHPQKEVTKANRSKLVRKTAELLRSLSVPPNQNIASEIHSVKTFSTKTNKNTICVKVKRSNSIAFPLNQQLRIWLIQLLFVKFTMNLFKAFLLTVCIPSYPQHTQVLDTKFTWMATQKKHVKEKNIGNEIKREKK